MVYATTETVNKCHCFRGAMVVTKAYHIPHTKKRGSNGGSENNWESDTWSKPMEIVFLFPVKGYLLLRF